ncbi:uncharacterized protein LOC143029085 [Oratosquilla oratoria]|uniref:uncharacterized protein LOC143029085 n=1 Tax=Oratosquilla oratoria TaxID=337810 RepID=UPI003F773D2F
MVKLENKQFPFSLMTLTLYLRNCYHRLLKQNMAALRSILYRLWPFKSENNRGNSEQHEQKDGTKKITRVLGPWESYMVTIQSILIWEKPPKSALSVVAVNVLFWLLVASELRVYFVLSVVVLGVFLHQQWVHSIWPEIRLPPKDPEDTEEWTPVHPSVLSVPEISRYVEGSWRGFRDNLIWLKNLRRTQPAVFCALISTCLSMFAIVGHLVPGVVLVYATLMFLMTGPGILIHIIPTSFYTKVAQIRAALRGDNSVMEASHESLDNDLAEFLPEEKSAEAQAALDVPLMSQDPTEDQSLEEEEDVVEEVIQEQVDKKGSKRYKRGSGAGSAPSDLSLPIIAPIDENSSQSFTTGLNDFPSYDHDSVDDLDIPDIEPPELPHPKHTRDEMKFVSSHFGESSEEEEFAEGLTFEEKSQSQVEHIGPRRREARQARAVGGSEIVDSGLSQIMSTVLAQNAGSVFSALGQNLVSSVIGQVQQHHESIEEEGPRSTSLSSARQQHSVTDLEEDFEMISDDEFQ